tara:strand:+ start:1172 stop:1837 length:666 start_codon:yes stop_codon:yes gene_type:complete
MITFALPKGRIFKEVSTLLRQTDFPEFKYEDISRNLVIETDNPGVRLLIVRSQDVPTYVHYGAADIGVVGSDVLDELDSKDVYQPLDLGIGLCRLSVAVRDIDVYMSMLESDVTITIATKYPQQTLEYFCRKGKNVNLVKLYGSIELAPLVELSHAVVDLVSTGNTLKANGLVEVELIKNISSRLIINKASLKLKDNLITEILEGLRLVADEKTTGKTIND